jgi:hypothetical protein
MMKCTVRTCGRHKCNDVYEETNKYLSHISLACSLLMKLLRVSFCIKSSSGCTIYDPKHKPRSHGSKKHVLASRTSWCPSVRVYNRGSSWTDFRESGIGDLTKIRQEKRNLVKIGKKNWFRLHEDLITFYCCCRGAVTIKTPYSVEIVLGCYDSRCTNTGLFVSP